MTHPSRRDLLKWSALTGVGLLAGGRLANAATLTPPQTEGPFFPVHEQADTDADLTRIEGQKQQADGQVVEVRVHLTDSEGRALSESKLDVWQACSTGRYKHPRDPNPAELDPHFQYWAKLQTNDEGRCSFKTIVPGAYPASRRWMRPPHIHFRIRGSNDKQLTTQMYFKGNELNDDDLILADTANEYGREARDSLIVDFTEPKTDEGPKLGIFRIVLGRTPEIESKPSPYAPR